MTKYKEYFENMVRENKELFDSFKRLHDEYALNPDNLQDKFNKEGEKVLEVTRQWENKLCKQSEKAGYSKYTTNLSEKFQAEVKKLFPMIDHVGIIAKKEKAFFLKKISF